MTTDLDAAHDAAHARLDDHFFRILEELTALRPGTIDLWDQLTTLVIAHQQAEEDAFAHLLDDTLEPPRGASRRIFEPEHRQLLTLLAAGRAQLVALAAAPTDSLRAHMVRSLEPLLRVHHLLSHHYERERTLIYPFIRTRLSGPHRTNLLAALAAPTPR